MIENLDLLYEQMSVEPLQVVILAKREKNGNASPTGCAAMRRRAYGTIPRQVGQRVFRTGEALRQMGRSIAPYNLSF